MTAKNQLLGHKFSRLTVVADGGRDKKKNVLWRCECECGGSALALAYDLKGGKVQSCGCLVREGTRVTHGQGRGGGKRNPVYSIWASMVQRCVNQKDRNWARYGGRGITVCEEWRAFENFYADMGDKPAGLTLDRADNNLGYNKDNCRWSSMSEQSRNKRGNVWIDIGGETRILADWVSSLGLCKPTIYKLIKKGLSHGDAIERILGERQGK